MGNYCFLLCQRNNDHKSPPDPRFDKIKIILVKMNLQFINDSLLTKRIKNKAFLQYHQVTLHNALVQNEGQTGVKSFIYVPQPNKSLRIQLYQFIKRDLTKKSINYINKVLNTYFKFIHVLLGLTYPMENAEIKCKDHAQTQEQQIQGSVTSNSQFSQEVLRFPKHNESLHPVNMSFKTTSSPKLQHMNDDIRKCYSSFFTNIHDKQILSNEEIQNLIQNQLLQMVDSHEVLELLFVQCNFIFELTRQYINLAYMDIIEEHLGRDADEFPKREILIERLVQHFLLTDTSPISQIILPFLPTYFNHQDDESRIRSISAFKGSIYGQSEQSRVEPLLLDKTLQPRSNPKDELIDAYDSLCYSSFIAQETDDKVENIFDTIKYIKQTQQESRISQIKAIIEKSELLAKQSQIPYFQTFPLIMRIVKVRKYWKKFNLIQKLDKQIVFLFMRKRSESQYNKFFDTIQAEDSKSEILFFILNSFQKAYPQINLERELFIQLRAMHDFDGFLHHDLKFVFCPDFLRFHNILELLLHNELFQ